MNNNWEKEQKIKLLKKLSAEKIMKIKELLWLDFINCYPLYLEIDTATYIDNINEDDDTGA